jgi:hypothetical protein
MSGAADKDSSVMTLSERHRLNDLRQLEIHRLLGDLEVMLAEQHRWFDLTRVQRRELPAAQPFYDLEDELEELGHESAQLVIDLRDLPTSSMVEVIEKLKVVARVIEPDDYPDAHAVLTDAIEDLITAQR